MQRATLHNKDEIARKDIRVGDYVLVEKAGEVIPAVIEVNLQKRKPGARVYHMPEQCPVCGTATIQLEGEVATALPERELPGAGSPPARALRLQGLPRHRRHGERHD